MPKTKRPKTKRTPPHTNSFPNPREIFNTRLLVLHYLRKLRCTTTTALREINEAIDLLEHGTPHRMAPKIPEPEVQ